MSREHDSIQDIIDDVEGNDDKAAQEAAFKQGQPEPIIEERLAALQATIEERLTALQATVDNLVRQNCLLTKGER